MPNLRTRLRDALRDHYSGSFALVMATGIVSIACDRLGYEWIAWPLLAVNAVAYGVLWALLLARLAWHRRRLVADLVSHAAGPGFFTVVAGTGVLGAQVLLLTGQRGIAEALWWLTVALWVVLIYTFFLAVTVREDKPSLPDGLSGAWLIAIVATQSIAVLGSLLALHRPAAAPVTLFFLVCTYLLGGMLYLFVINLILYRFAFFHLPPETLTPPYWINMGAVAITTLAGANLVLVAPQSPLLTALRPFLAGFTLFFWSFATWWIPLLFLLGAWRHLARRVPLTYHPAYWGMVFPLGMYTTCTWQLAKALDTPFLALISRGFVFLALAAWAAAFVGLLGVLWRFFLPRRPATA